MSLGDRLAEARTKVAALRIKELQECLERLRERKTGRKNELQQRLLTALDDSKLAGLRPPELRTVEAQLDMAIRVVDDAHLKMQRERPHWTLSDPAERAYYASLAPAPAQPAPAPPQPPAPVRGGANGVHPGAANPYMVMAGRPAGAGASGGGRQQTINFGQAAAHQHQHQQAGSTWQHGAGAHQHGSQQQPQQQSGMGGHTQANGIGALYRQAPGLGGAGHVNGYGTGGAGTSGIQPPAPPAHIASSTAIRCICGEAVERGEMVQCHGCGSWQHGECMALPALAPGQRRPLNSHFCERCRVERADPFWQGIVTNLLQRGKLKATGKFAACGTKNEQVQYLESMFTVSPAQFDMFKKNGNVYRMQACCLQLNDTVPFRFHWPCCADLKVNGTQYRVYGRASHTKLGANQRDEPANIGVLCQSGGRNRISLQCNDSTPYALLLQLAKQRSLEEVKALMKPTLGMEEAVAWVKKQMRGGGSEEDDDLEITHTRLSLKCPLSGTRISTPARFVDVSGLNCFDLDTFLLTASRSRKWQCPHTMRNSCVQQLQVDTYVAAILEALKGQPDISEVDIGPDGRWRPAGVRKGCEAPWVEPGGQLPPPAPATEQGAGGGGPYVKPEPQENGGTGVVAGGADSDEESEDPAEELRKAVAAMKRGRPPSPEVITIDSDDDLGPVQPSGPGAGAGRPGVGPSSQQQQQQANGAPVAKRPAVGPGPGGGALIHQHQQPPVPLQPPGATAGTTNIYQAVYGAPSAAAGRQGIPAPPSSYQHLPPQPPPPQPPLPPSSHNHLGSGAARPPTQWNPPLPFPVVHARPQQSTLTEGSGETTPGGSGRQQGSGSAGGGGLRITIRPFGSGGPSQPRPMQPPGPQQGPSYGGQQGIRQQQQGMPPGAGGTHHQHHHQQQQQQQQGMAQPGAYGQPHHHHHQPRQHHHPGSSHAPAHPSSIQQGPGYVVGGGAGGVPAMQRGGSAAGGMPLGLAVLSTAAATEQPYRAQQPPQPPPPHHQQHQHQQQLAQGASAQWQQRRPGTGAAAAPAAAPARNNATIDVITISDSDDD